MNQGIFADQVGKARPKVMAALVTRFQDLPLAEDAVAEAVARAWAISVNDRPKSLDAWLYVTACRWAIDRLRKDARVTSLPDNLIDEQPDPEARALADQANFGIPDERLRLIFICCHPALADHIRVALILKIVFGVSTEKLAIAFGVAETTMAQRLVRAKAKIKKAGIPFAVPSKLHWPDRYDAVLASLELIYTMAYGDAAMRIPEADLVSEALHLSAIMTELFPDEPEMLAFAALVRFAESRRKARVDKQGCMVPLRDQDPQNWDGALIAKAFSYLGRAAKVDGSGPIQLMATIHAIHAQRYFGQTTDWQRIVLLYDLLLGLRPLPAVRLGRVVALSRAGNADKAVAELKQLENSDQLMQRSYHAVHADILANSGRARMARQAYQRALGCAPPPAERKYLMKQLAGLKDQKHHCSSETNA